MIESMIFFTMTGPKSKFDSIVLQYLSHYEIQYESPACLKEQFPVSYPMIKESPYTHALSQAACILPYLDRNQPDLKLINPHKAIQVFSDLMQQVSGYLDAIASLNVSIHQESTSTSQKSQLLLKLNQNQTNLLGILYAKRLDILSAYKTLRLHEQCFELRTYAVSIPVSGTENELFLLCGYMSQEKSKELLCDFLSNRKINFTIYDTPPYGSEFPVRLTNASIFAPFSKIVSTYGLPRYTSLDPSLTAGISFSLFFGFLFGDIGYGLLLFLLGALLLLGRQPIGKVYCLCGFLSLLTGLLLGQCFGSPLSFTLLPVWKDLNRGLLVRFYASFLILLLSSLSLTIRLYYQKHILNIQKRSLGDSVLFILLAGFFGFAIYRNKISSGFLLLLLMLLIPLFCLIFSIFRNNIHRWICVLFYAVVHTLTFFFVWSCSGQISKGVNLLENGLTMVLLLLLESIWIYLQLYRFHYFQLFFCFDQRNGLPFTPYSYHSEAD